MKSRLKILPKSFQVWIITFLILVLFCGYLYPQKNSPPVFEHIALDKGLSQSAIHAIFQDSRGFMWFGTIDGLNMYDGYTFTIFRNNSIDSSSISDNWITSICEDSENNLWIGTADGGLNKFDPSAEKFHRYKSNPGDDQSLSDNSVNVVFSDSKNQLYVGTREGGLNILNKNKKSFTRFLHNKNNPESISSNRVREIVEDKEGNIWIGTDNGLNLYDKKGKFKRYLYNQDLKNKVSIRSLFLDSEGVLWTGVSKGLYTFDKGIKDFNKVKIISKGNHFTSREISVSSIVECDSAGLWLGTWDYGVLRFDKKTGELIEFSSSSVNGSAEVPGYILSSLKDKTGNIWVGTFFSGIYKYSPDKSYFTNFIHNPSDDNSPGNTITWGIYEDEEGYVWIGSTGGWLNRYDKETNTFTRYKKPRADTGRHRDSDVSFITSDRYGNLWLGMWGEGLSMFNKKTGTFTNFYGDPSDEDHLSNNFIRFIHIDKDGLFWIGTSNGLNVLDADKIVIKKYFHNPDDSTSLSHDRVSSIHEDKDGKLWIGTLGGGLDLFDRKAQRFIHHQHDVNNPFSVSSDRIRIIFEDSSGTLWAGTDNGLNKFIRDENKFISYTTSDGLPNNVIYGILPDDEGNLWMSTNKGISKFNPDKIEFRNYDIRDGLPSDEYNVHSYCRTRDGEMFFGSNYGFTKFNPSEIRDKIVDFPIAITSFTIFDKVRKRNLSVMNRNEVELNHNENFFSFEFAALNYSVSNKSTYAYKLDGFDEDWIYCGSRRYASYTNLDPGTYYFRVISSSNNIDWYGPGAPVKLIIHPPFWKTWWFLTMAAAAFVFILVMIHRYRLNIKLKQVLEIERVRKGIADDFHDELGHKLTKISLYSSLIKKNIKDEEDYVEKIQTTASTLFNDTKDFIWSVDPGKDSLYDIAVYLKDFGDSLFDKTGIAFDVLEITNEFEKIKLPMDWKRQIILIFKEAMNNILKHSSACNAALSVSFSSECIKIVLSDDGSGTFRENPGGRGIINMRSRAQKIEAQLFIDPVPGKGTSITLVSRAIQLNGSSRGLSHLLNRNVSSN